MSHDDARPPDGPEFVQALRPAQTLGQRLDHAARQVVARRLPAFPWLRSLEPLLSRVAALPVPDVTRFRRIDSPISPRFVPPTADAAFGGTLGPPAGPTAGSTAERATASAPGIRAVVPAGRPLPADARAKLGAVVGPATATALRVHEGPAADAVAQGARAAAITVGRDVFFAAGRFQPREPEGFALLAHEASHVLRAISPGAAWRRATRSGVEEEEREAEAVASAARGLARTSRSAPPTIGDVVGQLGVPTASPARPARVLLAAPAGPLAAVVPVSQYSALRPMAAPAATPAPPAGEAPATAAGLEAMREQILRDLMRRIRSEFERGA